MGGDFLGDIAASYRHDGLYPRNTQELITRIALTAQGLDANKPEDQKKELALRKLLAALLDLREVGLLD